ncbi:DUF6154 family protein [Cytobacillus sp. Hz8]|uniref:DUF6154 family protein n=1 Tax=Cytobacillus sp. Hz8 TaxID=3347168 RepID=UPI0035DFD7D0
MKIIDDLYELYRNKLTGDEEDIDLLAFAFLEEMTREDLIKMIQDLNDQELYNLVGIYLIESLKGKFAQEEYGQGRASYNKQRHLH